MPEVGFPELILIAIVGLLVIGPERLPETLRTLGLWFGRMRRSFNTVKAEIEKEIGMDEVKRQLHNEAIMEEMKRIESEVKATASDVHKTMNDTAKTIESRPVDPNPAALDDTSGHEDAATATSPGSQSEDPVETPAEASRANNG